MSALTLNELSAKMRKIDFCALSTKATSDAISSRPMSNNGDVDYDGDSWFFSYEDTRKVAAISSNPQVSLSFSAAPSLLGKPGIFVSVEGHAELIKDKSEFAKHWVDDLGMWFPEGVDTPRLVLLKVHAERIEYWDGDDNAVIALN